MNEIKVIDRGLSVGIYCNGQPVCTTEQLSEAYGADRQLLINNFNRNKERYQEGKHYICLTGEDLKAYKTANQNDLSSSRINQLYLWTERGALLHAKSLNTDKAWEVYERLVDFYFNIKESSLVPAHSPAFKEKVVNEHTVATLQAMRDIVNDYNLTTLRKPTIIEPFGGFYDEHDFYLLSGVVYKEYMHRIQKKALPHGSLYLLLNQDSIIKERDYPLKTKLSKYLFRKVVNGKNYHLIKVDCELLKN